MKSSINELFNRPSASVWQYFAAISKIPRPSKHEERVREYIKELAHSRKWQYQEDEVGNICVSLPGKGILKNSPILIIQGHMDMVCEKNNDSNHDFMNDPVQLQTDGCWVSAKETTLGADNGIALAMMLALTEIPFNNCCPLELLFTIDEETGLTGAMELDPKIVKGKKLLNIDSEDEGVFTIGCAGGIDLLTKFSIETNNPQSELMLNIHIIGLRGGHSGISIHENRGNAIITGANLLDNIRKQSPNLTLISAKGGNKKNAIPREAIFSITGIDREVAETEAAKILSELHKTESNAVIEIIETDCTSDKKIPLSFIDFLIQIPNGVLAMDPNFPNLVQSSSSAGVARTGDDYAEILMHTRSSMNSFLDEFQQKISSLAKKNGGITEKGHRYSGWNPNPDTNILKHGKKTFEQFFGKTPEITSIHAGLECGIIGDKIGTDELLSIGPTIENAHSPTERLHIESTERTFEFLKIFVSCSLPD